MDTVSKLLGSWLGLPPQQQRQQQYIFTVDEINERLQSLSSPITGWRSQGARISEKVVREIQTLLQLLDDRRNRYHDAQWSRRPRLYAILRNIQAVEFMDDFIRDHVTDFNLPFNEQTLPKFIDEKEGMNLRLAFFNIQDYFLTDVKDIESEKSRHLTLSVSGDTYFISEGRLGQGSFGGVDLVFSRLSGECFARKRVLRYRGSEQSQRYLIQELRELRRLSHQHLVQIIGSYTDTEYIAYLMKPIASGTLDQFLNRSRPLRIDEKELLRPFYGCLAGAMNYLHTNRIRHRDLTARNILIDSSWNVYISDFGSSYSWEFKPSSKTKHRNVPTSPDYMAPEVAKDDERGTKSDMWSLGIVFLEMTTKLLGHRLVSLRNKIRQNAEKEKVKPYPYANMTVVINWMKTLGATNTDYEHDKEPLGWIRELLHLEHEHRLTPPQLMRYVSESPSFHAFCCLKCVHEFQNEASIYDLIESGTNARQDSQLTWQEVEEVFSDINSLTIQSEHISGEGTASIERWLEKSYRLEAPAMEIQKAAFLNNVVDIDNTPDFDFMRADQFLYKTYEHEIYNPTYVENQSQDTGPFPSLDLTESVELPGETTWFEDNRDDSHPNVKVEKREKRLQDSELGFLEYMSNSTNDVEPDLPFEEISDRSSIQSEEILPTLASNDPLNAIFYEEALRETERESRELLSENSGLQFDEVEDKSDSENPWDERSDRSESGDGSRDGKQEAMHISDPSTRTCPVDYPNAGHAETLIHEQSGPVDQTPHSPVSNNEARKIEIDDVDTLSHDGQAPLPAVKEQTGNAEDVQEPPPPYTPSHLVLVPALRRVGSQSGGGGKKKSSLVSRTKTKPKKKVEISSKVEHIEEKQPERHDHVPAPAIPDIIIHGVANPHPEGQPLSEDNVRSMNESIRPPRVPRSRDALIPIDTRKLMDNTWDLASSAPTSVISEATKSKISKFFFMIPNERQIESLLTLYCEKGSVSAVKTVLQKVPLKAKSSNKRKYFHPLISAVRGASSRHNKCVRELLAAGVDPNQQLRKTGQTPLHIAVQNSNFKGYTNLIWLLLSNNANPNIRDKSDESPLAKLFVGADDGPLELHKRGALMMLLKGDANPNFTISGTGNTPLHLAVRRQDKISVAALLYKGAHVDAKTTGGTTPLIMTANQFKSELSADHAEVLEHLLQHGAKVDERAGVDARTALHWAVIPGCAQAVVRLLEAGADANLKDKHGHDAMWFAMRSAEETTPNGDEGKLADHVEIMLALDKAAKSSLSLKNGECAIETACKSQDGAMLEQLLAMGLDPKSKYRHGSILDFANEQGSSTARWILAEFEKHRR